jgi:hypothetical protein
MDRKRLLVLSDTHGHIRALEAILNWAQVFSESGGINAGVFLGDGASDLSFGANASAFEWKMVQGNNDFGVSLPLSDVLDFNDHRFFLCHGHRCALHDGYHTLAGAARNMKAEAALFGHTHIPCNKNCNNILLVNPGSVGRPRSRSGATFAVIECLPKEPLIVEFWGIDAKGKIKKIEL